MISIEQIISVGIVEGAKEVNGIFNGIFELSGSIRLNNKFKVVCENGKAVLFDQEGIEVIRSNEILCQSHNDATFTIQNVTIGIDFHWQKKENQTFRGRLKIISIDNKLLIINEIGIEEYLKSVISSEMSGESPVEFLKAQAVTSRSWLVAMLEKQRKSKNINVPSQRSLENESEIVRWYDREDHQHYDVCADDHCQRYQGITKIISRSVEEAVNETRGMFLVYKNQICDARFSKACGGRTELFESCWEDTPIPYLQSISDSTINRPQITDESDAENWIFSSPDCYCNTSDINILKQVLPSFDQATSDFFRWEIQYSQKEIAEILFAKSGIDFGVVTDIVPIKRGPSGRIFKLKIVGTKRTIIIGKELEIRRWLSKTHLYSSAFILKTELDVNNIPIRFIFHGAGWGHGVGLCQIGAAMMAGKRFRAEEIIKHYFRGVEIRSLY